VKKNWLGYGLLALLVVVFGLLWAATGELIGAVLSIIVLALGIGLLVTVLGYFISNAPAWFRHFRGVSWEDHLEQLETKGEAVRDEYQARDQASL